MSGVRTDKVTRPVTKPGPDGLFPEKLFFGQAKKFYDEFSIFTFFD